MFLLGKSSYGALSDQCDWPGGGWGSAAVGDVEVVAAEAARSVGVEEHLGAVGEGGVDVAADVDGGAPGVLALVAGGDPEVERGRAGRVGHAAGSHCVAPKWWRERSQLWITLTKQLLFAPTMGPVFNFNYDIIVVTAGAVTRRFPITGSAEPAVGLKHIEEAIAIRNRLLAAFDQGSNQPAGPKRGRLLGQDRRSDHRHIR